MLELRGVSREVGGVKHLSDVSIRLERGELNILLGQAQSGKTSLLRVMAGLEKPGSGEVWFDGQNVTGKPFAKRNVAMVEPQLVTRPRFTVRDTIASPLKARKMADSFIEREVARVAELLRLKPYLDRKTAALPDAMRQRVALARAIVQKSGLILLDEPLASLHPMVRDDLRAELSTLFANCSAVVVYATADPAEALMLGGWAATLNRGRIIQFGPTSDVYRHPNSLVTAMAFSDPPLNVFPPEAGIRQNRYPGASVLAVRPHHLRLQRKTSRALSFSLEVLSTEIKGSETCIYLNHGAESWVMLARGVHAFAPGSPLAVHVEPDDILEFGTDGAALGPVAEAA